jgi:hypothetical protein
MLIDLPRDGQLLYTQEFSITDFKLKEFKFYQQGDVLMLKGED